MKARRTAGTTVPPPLEPLEIELKYQLSPTSHRKLMRALPKRGQRLLQLNNYYFDDPKLGLRRRRIGFRLRLTNRRRAVLTLKLPHRQAARGPAALKIRREYEASIPMAKARLLLSGRLSLKALDVSPVKRLRAAVPEKVFSALGIIGMMEMTRRKALLSSGLVVELDSFTAFGKKFYELEVETTDPVASDRTVRELLKRHRIPCRPLGVSKLARFLSLLDKKNRPGRP